MHAWDKAPISTTPWKPTQHNTGPRKATSNLTRKVKKVVADRSNLYQKFKDSRVK